MAGRQESKGHTVPAPGVVHPYPDPEIFSPWNGNGPAHCYCYSTCYVTLGDLSGCTHVTGVEYEGQVTASRVQYYLQSSDAAVR